MDPKVAAAAFAKLQAEIDRIEALGDRASDAELDRLDAVSERYRELADAEPDAFRAYESGIPDDVGDAGAAEPAPAPAPAPAPLQQAPQASAQPAPGGGRTALGNFGDWLTEGATDAGRYLGETALDAGRAAGGMLSSAMPALAAYVTPEAKDAPGVPRREYAAGSADADMLEQNRRDAAEAAQRSPIATGAARGLTTAAQIAGPMALVGGAPAAAAVPSGALAGTAVGAANAAAPAMVAGAIERGGAALDPRRSFGDWMGQAFEPSAMATDATIGMAVPAAVSGVSEAAGAVGGGARAGSEWLRGRAVGAGELNDAARAQTARSMGVAPSQVTREVGRRTEALGLPGASKLPMTSSGYSEAAGSKASELGKPFGEILDRASGTPQLRVGVPKARVLDRLRDGADDLSMQPGPDAASKGKAFRRAIESDLEGKPYGAQSVLTPRDLHDLKRAAEKAGGFKQGEAPAPPSRLASKEGNREAAAIYRDELGNAMERTDDALSFRDLNQRIGDARTIQGIASGPQGRSDMTGAVARGLRNPAAGLWDVATTIGADAGATGFKGTAMLGEGMERAGQAALPLTPATASTFAQWLSSGDAPPVPPLRPPMQPIEDLPPTDEDDGEFEDDEVALTTRARRQQRSGAERR